MKTQTEKSESIAALRKLCPIGSTIYTVLRHRSSSGMFRVIDLFVIKKGKPVCIAWHAARAMGYKLHGKKEGLSVSGCGMDMGYHLVNSLSYAIHGMSPKKEKAGYTLNHRWL